MSNTLVNLQDYLFYQEGPGVRKHQFTSTGIKLLNGGNINNNSLNLSSTKIYISEEEAYGKYSHFMVDEGDLLIASSGIVVDNFPNKIAFARREHLPLCMNTSTIRFKSLDKQKLDIKYFSHYLKSRHFTYQIGKLITGSAQLNFGPSHLRQIKLILPPLATQKAIAEKLDKADALRKKDQQLLKLYDELAQSVFIEMFGDPVRNEKGWEVQPVISNSKCIVPGRDKPKRFTGDIPWVTTEDLNHLSYTFKSRKGIGLNIDEITEVRAKVIPSASVLMTCVGDLGVISIAKKEMVVNQQLHAFQPNKQLEPLFLAYMLSHQKPYMFKMASKTTVPYMNKTICNSIPVFLPPITLQKSFVLIIENIELQKEKLKQQITESENLFQSLLQESFS